MGLPIIGQSLDLIRAMKSSTAEMWLEDLTSKYGPVSKLSLFSTTTISLAPPLNLSSPSHMDPASRSPPSSTSSILIISILGILTTAILLLIYYFTVVKCGLNLRGRHGFITIPSRRHRSHHHAVPLTFYSAPTEFRGLEPSSIRAIPVVRFSTGRGTAPSSAECAVCLNEFREEESLRLLPSCSHAFHIDCIVVWLQSNANCPLCRSDITTTRIMFPFNMRDESAVIEVRDVDVVGSSCSGRADTSQESGKNKARKKGRHVSRELALWQYWRAEGMEPERDMDVRVRPRTRFSCGFQQETPAKLQTKPTVVLAKFQQRLPVGSERADLTPRRHQTSSSWAEEVERRRRTRRRRRRRQGGMAIEWEMLVELIGLSPVVVGVDGVGSVYFLFFLLSLLNWLMIRSLGSALILLEERRMRGSGFSGSADEEVVLHGFLLRPAVLCCHAGVAAAESRA